MDITVKQESGKRHFRRLILCTLLLHCILRVIICLGFADEENLSGHSGDVMPPRMKPSFGCPTSCVKDELGEWISNMKTGI